MSLNPTQPLEPLSAAGLEAVARLTREAGALVMAVYATDFAVRAEADEKAEALLLSGLNTLFPGIPIVAEEAVAAGGIPQAIDGPFWLVDPLDGTKEFISRNGEFTVNVALVRDGQPVLGVVLAPALDRLFAGAQGLGAYVEQGGERRAIQVRAVPEGGLTVVGSRSHGDADAMNAFLNGRKVAEFRSAGSSLKLCLVA